MKKNQVKHGGSRIGAGRPKGKSSLAKEAAREVARQLITREIEPLIQAQIAHAKGIQHFFLRDDKTKQFVRIKDPKAIETALNCSDEGSYYWIFTKDPSVQAFTDLMNRALDKPAEQTMEKTANQSVTLNVDQIQIAVALSDDELNELHERLRNRITPNASRDRRIPPVAGNA